MLLRLYVCLRLCNYVSLLTSLCQEFFSNVLVCVHCYGSFWVWLHVSVYSLRICMSVYITVCLSRFACVCVSLYVSGFMSLSMCVCVWLWVSTLSNTLTHQITALLGIIVTGVSVPFFWNPGIASWTVSCCGLSWEKSFHVTIGLFVVWQQLF